MRSPVNHEEFYEIWRLLRIIAVVLATAFGVFSVYKAHAWNLEVEYCGPGSEYERSMREYDDRDNRAAWERVDDDRASGRESSERDQERARDYERDHGA